MVHIYSAKIDKIPDITTYEYLLSFLSEERRERINKYHFKEDSLRSLYGEILVRHTVSKILEVKNETLKIERNSYGKPYIVGAPLHFNISHAGDWVVCALSTNEIGIDIELIKYIDYDIAKRFFCTCEYDALMEKDDLERIDFFYKLWTLKESYIKWSGTGLSTSLNSFCFKISETDILLIDKNQSIVPHFKQYCIDEDYKLSVCSESSDYADDVHEIDMENISLF